MTVDETRDRWAEGLFLVATNPDEEPVWALQTCRQSRADTRACADTDTTLVQRRSVGDTGELVDHEQKIETAVGEAQFTFNSRVHNVAGGSLTRLRVKSPCTPQIM